jgi:predicted membrane protein
MCVKNLTHCLHGVEYSPFAATATVGVKQSVAPYWEEVLCVNTISNIIRIYTLRIKANVSCVADYRDSRFFRILFSIYFNLVAVFSFVSLTVEIFCCQCTDKILCLSCSLSD